MPEGLDQQVSANGKNRRAPLAEIRSAKLRRGLLNGRLSLVLDDGTRIKLLWLKTDPAHDILAAGPSRLTCRSANDGERAIA